MIRVYYALLPLVATLLTLAQLSWNNFIKNSDPFHGSIVTITTRIISAPGFWIGAILYVLATLLYFIALSKLSFFVVQISITSLALLCSTLVASVFLHENLTAINYIGTSLVIVGLGCVIVR